MRANVSWLKAHMLCPQYASYRYMDGLEPEASIALEVGTLWHLGMAARIQPTAAAAQAAADELAAALATASPAVLREWSPLDSALASWRLPTAWGVIAVEREFEVPLGPHVLYGTPDAVVRWNGQYWHLQHKTLRASVPLDVYTEQQRTDWHECAYHHMLEHAGYVPIAGTILNIVRKLRTPAVSLHYMQREPEIVARALADMRRVLDVLDDPTPIRNRAACAGRFENKLCPFKSRCDGAPPQELRLVA